MRERCFTRVCRIVLRNADQLFLALVLLAMLIILTHQILLPGLYYDEAAHAVYGAWLLSGKSILWQQPVVYTIFGWKILASLGYYVGPLEGYVTLLSMYFLGISTLALRIPTILFTLLTTPFIFYFMKNRFGAVSAYATTLLFAFHPSILLYTKIGLWVFMPLLFFIFAALYFFDKWFRRHRTIDLALGSLLVGLGVQTFITAVWFVLAGAIVVFLYRRTRMSGRELSVTLVSFFCGVGPYLLPWLDGKNIAFFYEYSLVSHANVNNAAYFANLLTRIVQFESLSESTTFDFYGAVHMNLLNFALFVVSIAGIVVLFTRSITSMRIRKSQIALIILFCLMFLQTPLTINSLQPYQLIPLLPISLMIIGSFFDSVWNAKGDVQSHISSRKMRISLKYGRAVILLLLCSSILYDISVVHAYYGDLAVTGGIGRWSDATYAAAVYLESANCSYVAALDWGLSYPLLIASAGRLNIRDVFWTNESFENQVDFLIRTTNKGQLCFVSWTPEAATASNKLALLQRLLQERGDSLRLLKTFYQHDSTPIIMTFNIS